MLTFFLLFYFYFLLFLNSRNWRGLKSQVLPASIFHPKYSLGLKAFSFFFFFFSFLLHTRLQLVGQFSFCWQLVVSAVWEAHGYCVRKNYVELPIHRQLNGIGILKWDGLGSIPQSLGGSLSSVPVGTPDLAKKNDVELF